MSQQYAGYVDTRLAHRLASTINTCKVILIALIAVGAIGGSVVAPTELAVAFGLYGAVCAVSIYVTFGWLEHTLRLLIGIAFNTAEGADLISHSED